MQANRTQVKRLLHRCSANVIHATQMLLGVQRNGKEFLGTRIAHFELLHTGCVAPANEEEALEHGAVFFCLAAALAAGCAT